MRASSSAGVACATAAWGLVILLAVLASVPSTSASASTSAAAEASVPSTSVASTSSAAEASVLSTSAAAEASVPSTSASTSVASTSAAAEASVPSTSAASTSAAAEKGCNATDLATAIFKACIKGSESEPLTSCCSFILPTVDMVDCLCMVVDEPQIADSSTTSEDLFRLYLSCGGKRHSGDKPYESCDDFIETSSPSKEMNPPTPTSDHGSFKIEISTDAGVWVTALLTFIGMTYAAYEWITRDKGAKPPVIVEER